MTDENRVKQILINLISNSIKYTEEGYVRIVVSADQYG
jgi:signal transduction histidine kinase